VSNLLFLASGSLFRGIFRHRYDERRGFARGAAAGHALDVTGLKQLALGVDDGGFAVMGTEKQGRAWRMADRLPEICGRLWNAALIQALVGD
jgi:hypothetical protein